MSELTLPEDAVEVPLLPPDAVEVPLVGSEPAPLPPPSRSFPGHPELEQAQRIWDQRMAYSEKHPILGSLSMIPTILTGVPEARNADASPDYSPIGKEVASTGASLAGAMLTGGAGALGRVIGGPGTMGKILSSGMAYGTSLLGQQAGETVGAFPESSLGEKASWGLLDMIVGRSPSKTSTSFKRDAAQARAGSGGRVSERLIKGASELPEAERIAEGAKRSPMAEIETKAGTQLPGDKDTAAALRFPSAGGKSANAPMVVDRMIQAREAGLTADSLDGLRVEVDNLVGASGLGVDDIGIKNVRQEGQLGKQIGNTTNSIAEQQTAFVEKVAKGAVPEAAIGAAKPFRVAIGGIDDVADMPGVITQAEKAKGLVPLSDVLSTIDGVHGSVTSKYYGTTTPPAIDAAAQDAKEAITRELLAGDPVASRFVSKADGWLSGLNSRIVDLTNSTSALKQRLSSLSGSNKSKAELSRQLSNQTVDLKALQQKAAEVVQARTQAIDNARVTIRETWDVAKGYTNKLSQGAFNRGLQNLAPNYTASLNAGIGSNARQIRNAQAEIFGEEGVELIKMLRKFEAAKTLQPRLRNAVNNEFVRDTVGNQRFYDTARGFNIKKPIASTVDLMAGKSPGALTQSELYERGRLGRSIAQGELSGSTLPNAGLSPMFSDKARVFGEKALATAGVLGNTVGAGAMNPALMMGNLAENSPGLDQFNQAMAATPTSSQVVLPRHYEEVIQYLPQAQLPVFEQAIQTGNQQQVTEMVQAGLNLKFMAVGNQMNLGEMNSEKAAKEQAAISAKIAKLAQGSIFDAP